MSQLNVQNADQVTKEIDSTSTQVKVKPEKEGYHIITDKLGRQRYVRDPAPVVKLPKDGYEIKIGKDGKQRYSKIKTQEEIQQRNQVLTARLKEKAIPAMKAHAQVRKGQPVENYTKTTNLDHEYARTIREQLDEMKQLVKGAVQQVRAITPVRQQERTQSAPKVVEQEQQLPPAGTASRIPEIVRPVKTGYRNPIFDRFK